MNWEEIIVINKSAYVEFIPFLLFFRRYMSGLTGINISPINIYVY
jgi:hypothetical protein